MQQKLRRPDALYQGTHASPLSVKLGRKIKECRLILCITPDEFADDIGCSTAYVLKLEQGLVEPTEAVLQRCAEALGVQVTDLMHYSEGTTGLLL